MASIWFKPELADEIIINSEIFEQTHSIIADIMCGRLDITHIVENMGGVLTNKEAENREKGTRFFTKILKELPKDYLNNVQVKFISNFYIDRLKDNHRVIPPVLEGYLAIIDMKKYDIHSSAEFFTVLFREVVCQSQVRQDRYHIYLIVQKLLDKDLDFMKALGPDFVYGFISAMDGERDPRNLLFLFSFLPKFIANIPLGHLVEEMFDVISCYYPIDFHPAPDDPAAVTRQELATALCPCLCAIPAFGEQCLILLLEKLDSSLRLAKIDSLKLLEESCKTFNAESYGPFLKALWSSIHREISHKTDEELRMAAHEALSHLVAKLSTTANTDQAFENFVKGILISMPIAIAEATTVAQFVQATRVILTTGNASKESSEIVSRTMIPAAIAFYGLKTSIKLQIACLDFLGDLYELAKHWEVLNKIEKQVSEIPQLCLTAVSQHEKEYQLAGFKTLIRVINALDTDLVVPFVEVLVHNVQHSHDSDLLSISVETVHAIARQYPELIMDLVVKGKCDLDNLTQDKVALQERLNLLTNLASLDDFTKVIIAETLKLISNDDKEAPKVIEALSGSLSNASLYSNQKVIQIESNHGLLESILAWMYKEITQASTQDTLAHGYSLIANTVSSLPVEKQQKILSKHTRNILEKCKTEEVYFLLLECLYSSVHQSFYDKVFEEILLLSLKLALTSDNEMIRTKACVLIAHFLNKAEYGPIFELLYESLKNYLSSLSREDQTLCPKLIMLYGWLVKALIMRGSDLYLFWLQKVSVGIATPEYCKLGAEAVRLIMSDVSDYLSARQHSRISLLYKQRMFQTFSTMTEKIGPLHPAAKESFLLSWAYVIEKTPRSVLNNDVIKITPLIIDSLVYDNPNLLLVMIDVLCHFVQAAQPIVADSLQSVLPRLVQLSKYVKSMDVRIKSLQCIYDIANSYRTVLLLPYKQDLLLHLAPALDDKKRLVRSMAVKARTRWYLIGAPGEPKED